MLSPRQLRTSHQSSGATKSRPLHISHQQQAAGHKSKMFCYNMKS
jgi:hypothetical protein